MKEFCFVLLLFIGVGIRGQGIVKLTQLKIGDKVPDIYFRTVLNYKSKSVNLSEFSDKLIILDFWNNECHACINAVPELERLQHEFDGKLQVLLVNTFNTAEQLRGFPRNTLSHNLKYTKLPFILGSTELKQLFPHGSEPYHVWIDRKGIVRALTEYYNATPEHVRDILEDKDLHLALRRNENLAVDGKSILQPENSWLLSQIKGYSILLPSLYGGSSCQFLVDSATNIRIGYRQCDQPLVELFESAYNFLEYRDRVILEVSNAGIFIKPTNPDQIDSWRARNTYTYEFELPLSECVGLTDDILNMKFHAIMQQDLKRYFGVVGDIERRNVECLALIRTKNILLKTSGRPPNIEKRSTGFSVDSVYLKDFCSYLAPVGYGDGTLPIVDKTGFPDPVDLEINASRTDYVAIRKELLKYGLDLVEMSQQIDVLVLKDMK